MRPIVVDGETLGTVYLRSDLPDVRSRLYCNGSIMGVVMLAAVMVALLVYSFLQRLILRPIQHLADVAQEVSSGSNYGIRAVKEASNELGLLTDAFNSMLEQIRIARSVSGNSGVAAHCRADADKPGTDRGAGQSGRDCAPEERISGQHEP